MVPAYLSLSPGDLNKRAMAAYDILKCCTLCPKQCRVDRLAGERGFCRTGALPFVSSYGAHLGEEAPLVGVHGSGTIFFGNCNLNCVYCQNYSISHLSEGTEISLDALAVMMIALQEMGCHNVNLVSPSHQTAAFVMALPEAVKRGLSIPVVYNCGGYESMQALNLIDGIVDIYMPDLKYSDPAMSLRYSNAEAYPQVAQSAIKEMHRQVGNLVVDENGIATRGLLIRHLVLPNNIAGSRQTLEFIAREISTDTYINIMDQYHPCFKAIEHHLLNRRLTGSEYYAVLEYAKSLGLTRLDKEDLRGRWL
ncbi:MAG: radical SAM protein [Nitrospirae bacterium]|nr:radical SAM protein [Nitrospirota bacterium]